MGDPYALASCRLKWHKMVFIYKDWDKEMVCALWLHVTSMPRTQCIGPRSVGGHWELSRVLHCSMRSVELLVRMQLSTCTVRISCLSLILM